MGTYNKVQEFVDKLGVKNFKLAKDMIWPEEREYRGAVFTSDYNEPELSQILGRALQAGLKARVLNFNVMGRVDCPKRIIFEDQKVGEGANGGRRNGCFQSTGRSKPSI